MNNCNRFVSDALQPMAKLSYQYRSFRGTNCATLRRSKQTLGGWPMTAIKHTNLGTAILLAAPQIIQAQGILGNNLVVNGNAETGPAGTATTEVTSIPGWTGTANVLP